jgi:hypothetical protein
MLFIVARSARKRLDELRDAFGRDEQVDVIVDRRRGERRRRVVVCGVERRRAERRTYDVRAEMKRQGYAVVRRDD